MTEHWLVMAVAISKMSDVKRWWRLLLSLLSMRFMITPPQSKLPTALRPKGCMAMS